jgi:hypothetical protein
MIDLTESFRTAFNLKMNNKFLQSKWIKALEMIRKKNHFQLLWNDEEDNWLKLGEDNKLIILAARDMPLLFLLNKNLIEDISKTYGYEFIPIVAGNENENIYSLNLKVIKSILTWNTNSVSPNSFSLNDLFYATH